MSPLVAEPVWLHHPSVAYIQRSEATSGLDKEFAKIIPSIAPWNKLLKELDSFLAIENYNGFALRLGPEAHERAKGYLEGAYEAVIYPVPELTPDGEGGIDIEWENKGRHLALSVRTVETQPDFLSWREPEGRYEGQPATQELLNDRLRWLSR